jgi:hypothetical protein
MYQESSPFRRYLWSISVHDVALVVPLRFKFSQYRQHLPDTYNLKDDFPPVDTTPQNVNLYCNHLRNAFHLVTSLHGMTVELLPKFISSANRPSFCGTNLLSRIEMEYHHCTTADSLPAPRIFPDFEKNCDPPDNFRNDTA